MKTKTLPELNYLADLVGDFIEYWGFKKIHGKIWLHLYLSQEAMDAKSLISKLDVSKALISISLKDLLDYQVIYESGTSPEGTRLYKANPDLNTVIAHVLRQREKIMMGKIHAGFNQLKEMGKDDLGAFNIEFNRVKELDKFLKNGEKALNIVMATL